MRKLKKIFLNDTSDKFWQIINQILCSFVYKKDKKRKKKKKKKKKNEWWFNNEVKKANVTPNVRWYKHIVLLWCHLYAGGSENLPLPTCTQQAHSDK